MLVTLNDKIFKYVLTQFKYVVVLCHLKLIWKCGPVSVKTLRITALNSYPMLQPQCAKYMSCALI